MELNRVAKERHHNGMELSECFKSSHVVEILHDDDIAVGHDHEFIEELCSVRRHKSQVEY